MKTLFITLLAISSLCFGNDSMELLISPEEIAQKIQQAAKEIDAQYGDEELTLVIVMKGGICLGVDLMRQLHLSTNIEYIKASSYGQHGSKRGELKIASLDHLDLKDKNVLVVDDIFDSGLTMEKIVSQLSEKQPKSLRSIVLLMKNVPHATTYRPDYVLFEIENKFVIGYGLDFKEKYRNLPGVYAINE